MLVHERGERDWTVATLLRASPSWQESLLDAWASSPASVYFTNFQSQLNWPASPAAEIHPPRLVSSAIVRAAACRQGRNRCPGLRVQKSRAGGAGACPAGPGTGSRSGT